eukprot:gene31849-38510_t
MIVLVVLFVLAAQSVAFQWRPPLNMHPLLRLSTVSPEAAQLSHADIVTQIRSKFASQKDAAGSGGNGQLVAMLDTFVEEYARSSQEAGQDPQAFQKVILTFISSVQSALKQPYQFSPYHPAIRSPFDYYTWGNDFIRPLIIQQQSRLVGEEHARDILDRIKRGENVCILSNHQTEADPQVISILLEQAGLGELAERIIFVAGHKVTSDPVAIPFSMGRNLICIHSKKHIHNPPEDMPRKQAQNLESMNALKGLLSAGGQVVWVAPSGGRDRPNSEGKFVVSPYDLKSLDMFKLLQMQSQKPMQFFPMAMYTHTLVPPPKEVSSELGEQRSAQRGAVSVAFLPPTSGLGKLQDRPFLTELQGRVEKSYEELYLWHEERRG